MLCMFHGVRGVRGLMRREELEWMRRVGGKREIEAVCETWVGGLVGYLTWKLRRVLRITDLEVEGEMEDIIALEGMQGISHTEERDPSSISGAVMETGNLASTVEAKDYESRKSEEDILLQVDDDEDKENQYFEDIEEDILDLDDMNLAHYHIVDMDGIIDI